MAKSPESLEAYARLVSLKQRSDFINYRTGFEDGISAIQNASFLLFDCAVSLIHIESPEAFIQASEASGFPLAEYTAAKLSGIEDLNDFPDLYGVTSVFFSAITQKLGDEYPPDSYVRDFIYGINFAVDEVFHELDEAGLVLYEA